MHYLVQRNWQRRTNLRGVRTGCMLQLLERKRLPGMLF
jgi:hypothetical protein